MQNEIVLEESTKTLADMIIRNGDISWAADLLSQAEVVDKLNGDVEV